MSQDFKLMQPLVNKLSESLDTEPENWKFGSYYITSPVRLGSIQIYIDLHHTFTEVKSTKGSTHTERVFSQEQGELLRKAYNKALSITGSKKQQELLKVLEKQQTEESTVIEDIKKSSTLIPLICILSLVAIYIVINLK